MSLAMSKGKSRITNQPKKLAGVDNRSTHGRRRRDLITDYITEKGGQDSISPATMNDITRAADLVALSEKLRGDALRGQAVDLSELIKVENAADRAVRRLAIKPGTAQKPLTMRERLMSAGA